MLTLTLVILVNIPIYFLLGRSFFGNWNGFFQAIVAIIQPDIVSAVSGNYREHKIGRFTLMVFLLVCGATTAAQYHVVAKFILGIDNPWG